MGLVAWRVGGGVTIIGVAGPSRCWFVADGHAYASMSVSQWDGGKRAVAGGMGVSGRGRGTMWCGV